jgi:hypothetical protein
MHARYGISAVMLSDIFMWFLRGDIFYCYLYLYEDGPVKKFFVGRRTDIRLLVGANIFSILQYIYVHSLYKCCALSWSLSRGAYLILWHVDPFLGNELGYGNERCSFLETNLSLWNRQACPWIWVIKKHFLGYRYAIRRAVQIRTESVTVEDRLEDKMKSSHSGASPRQSFIVSYCNIVVKSDCKGVINKSNHPIQYVFDPCFISKLFADNWVWKWDILGTRAIN